MDIPSSKKIKTVNPMPVFSSAKKHESERQYQQSHYLNLIRTEGYASIDRYPLGIINIILGDGLSSRLNQKLREKLGLVYTVYSTLSLLSDAGTLGIYAAAELSKMEKIENMIKNEIQSICSSGFTDREIIKAKEQLKSSTIMALEGLSSRMQSNARMELSTGEYESVSDTITIVDSITKDQIHQVVKKYLAVENNCEVKLLGRKSD
jgi:predicted Zn-dependent peptidase